MALDPQRQAPPGVTVNGARNKPKPRAGGWAVSSVEYPDGRRAIWFRRTAGVNGSRSRGLRAFPVFGGTVCTKLRVQFAREQASAFRPTIATYENSQIHHQRASVGRAPIQA